MADRESERPAARPSGAPLRSPADWQRELNTPGWQFAAAEMLHGWREHAHHEGKPMALSRAAFEEALKAAVEPTRELKPSRNAVSPHRGKGL